MTVNTLVAMLGDNDVLLGRGTGPNDHGGNKKFRVMASHLLRRSIDSSSSSATTQLSKLDLARKLVAMVHCKKGKFVRKLTRDEAKAVARNVCKQSTGGKNYWAKYYNVKDLYVVVPEEVAISKAKQSFRHQLRLLLENNLDGDDNSVVVGSSDCCKSPLGPAAGQEDDIISLECEDETKNEKIGVLLPTDSCYSQEVSDISKARLQFQETLSSLRSKQQRLDIFDSFKRSAENTAHIRAFGSPLQAPGALGYIKPPTLTGGVSSPTRRATLSCDTSIRALCRSEEQKGVDSTARGLGVIYHPLLGLINASLAVSTPSSCSPSRQVKRVSDPTMHIGGGSPVASPPAPLLAVVPNLAASRRLSSSSWLLERILEKEQAAVLGRMTPSFPSLAALLQDHQGYTTTSGASTAASRQQWPLGSTNTSFATSSPLPYRRTSSLVVNDVPTASTIPLEELLLKLKKSHGPSFLQTPSYEHQL